ncbi:MAG: hypothetical protein ACNA8W_01780 [Bradymonadaceae bacterium]
MSTRPRLQWKLILAITLIFLGVVVFHARQDPVPEVEGEIGVENEPSTAFTPYSIPPPEANIIEGRSREEARVAGEEEDRLQREQPLLDIPEEIDEESEEESEDLIEEATEGQDWADPINDEVLGARTWMAQPTEEESARIEEVFEEAERRRAENPDTFQLEDRHTALEHARNVVERCFDNLLSHDPDIAARVIVAFDVHTGAGVGRVENGEVTVYFGDQNEAFEICVAESLNAITFGAVGEGEHKVEYPFFFDE